MANTAAAPDQSIAFLVVAKQDEQTGRWLAGSRELNVFSSGSTPQEAFDRAVEAISLFFEEVAEMGTLDKVIHEAGLRVVPYPHTPTALGARVRNAIGGFFSFPASIPIPKAQHPPC